MGVRCPFIMNGLALYPADLVPAGRPDLSGGLPGSLSECGLSLTLPQTAALTSSLVLPPPAEGEQSSEDEMDFLARVLRECNLSDEADAVATETASHALVQATHEQRQLPAVDLSA